MKKWLFGGLLFIAIILLLFITGHRFTPYSAAKSNTFLSQDVKLVEHYYISSTDIFLFKSDEDQKYQTVISEKVFGFLYRSRLRANDFPYSSDEVQTVGFTGFILGNDEGTMLSVISNDEDVSYIDVGAEPNIQRRKVKEGDRVSFLFPYSEQIDLFYPTAYDGEGRKLYYYGCPEGSKYSCMDMKWYPVEE